MKKAILFFLLCRYLPAQQSGVEGIATDSVTHQPMAGVHITLGAPSLNGGPLDTYGAMSQRDGHFSVSGMPPTVYFISARRNGYIYIPGKTPGVTLKPGEITTVAVEMTPQAAISGHVLDENGDPAERVQVNAIPSVSGSPESRLRFAMNAGTDERGQYRLTGAPGRYLLRATPSRWLMGGPMPDDEGGYGETYYPATGSKSQATVVTVTAGHETTGIDIRLIRKRIYTIGGAVTGMAANASTMILVFSRSNGSDRFNITSGINAGPDGKFSVHGLAAGHYRVVARTQEVIASAALQSQFVDVTLENSYAMNMTLTLARSESLSGVLETEGATAKNTPREMSTVRLEPYQQGLSGPPTGGEVGPDGAFRIEEIFPGEYFVHVVPLPENAYIESVNLDGAEMANGKLYLYRGAGGAKLNVKMSLNGGQLKGRIVDRDGQPLPTPAFVVLAASADEIQWEHLKQMP